MRQSISDAATRLFLEKGFDRVTVDEIAEAADVGRMTVFNHFPRKEDLFFGEEQAAFAAILAAVRTRRPGLAPIPALHRLAGRMIRDEASPIRFTEESRRWVEMVAASDALKARAREIRDEATSELANTLAAAAARPQGDLDARLAAQLLLATWTVAFVDAHAIYRRDEDAAAAKAKFLAVVDRGSAAVAGALAGTPYV
jgi:AcrR family transcriptional regulator